MRETEIRSFPLAELRYMLDDERPKIVGRAVVYNALSEDFGGVRERFAPGSVHLEDDLLALFDHQTSMVLGRSSAGTLEARANDDGVDMVAWPPDTQWARDLRVSMDRGDIRHMSFRFICLDDEVTAENGEIIRTVKAAEVSELSIVSMPAYTQTSAEVRSRADALREAIPAPDSMTGSDESGGSPDAAESGGGSPEHLFIAGGRVYTLSGTPKERES